MLACGVAGLRGAGRGEPGIDGLDAVARALGMTLRVSRVLISVFDERGQRLVGSSGLPDDRVGPMAVREVSPLARHVSMSARPVILQDARRRKGAGGAGLAALGVVAYAGMPVMAGDVAVGVVAAIDANVRAWSERDIEVLRTFADVTASILVRETKQHDPEPLEMALARERALTALLLRVAVAPTLAESLETLAQHTRWPCAELVSIDGGQLRILASFTTDRRLLEFSADAMWSADDDMLVRGALVSGHGTWVSDLPNQSGFVRARRAGEAGLKTGFAVVVPGHSTVLQLFTADPTPPREELSRLARGVAALLGPALVRIAPAGVPDRRTGELEVLALHDELTGLLNRRGFYAVANGQLAIARRKHLDGVVLFVDVDGLKVRNDRDGHAAGDELLRAAAGVLRSTFRESDTIGRVGGDEFVVFSIDAVERDIEKVVSRLSEELGRFNQARDTKARLSWSVGFNAFEAESSTSLDTLVVEADRRMYVAKRRQRAAPVRQPFPGSPDG